MEILSLIVNLMLIAFDSFLTVDFLLKFNGYLWKDKPLSVIVCAIIFIITCFTEQFGAFNIYAIIIAMVLCLGWLILFKFDKSSISNKIWSCILFYGTLIIVNTAILCFLQMIYESSNSILTTDLNGNKIALIVASKIAIFSLTRLYIKTSKYDSTKLKFRDAVILLILPVIDIGIIGCLTEITLINKLNSIANVLILISIIGIYFSYLILYYLFIQVSEKAKIKEEYELIKQQYEYEKKHYEEVKELYDKVSQLKHNIKNHLECVKGHIINSENTEALNYIEKVTEESSEIYSYINTSNFALNYIVNTKFTIAQSKGFKVSSNVTESNWGNISEVDLCSVLGNLLDNAIEAGIKEDERIILVEIAPKRGYQLFTIKNFCSKNILDENPFLGTTKIDKDNHGLGMKNIYRIAKKYFGEVDIYEKDRYFCVSLIIPN